MASGSSIGIWHLNFNHWTISTYHVDIMATGTGWYMFCSKLPRPGHPAEYQSPCPETVWNNKQRLDQTWYMDVHGCLYIYICIYMYTRLYEYIWWLIKILLFYIYCIYIYYIPGKPYGHDHIFIVFQVCIYNIFDYIWFMVIHPIMGILILGVYKSI